MARWQAATHLQPAAAGSHGSCWGLGGGGEAEHSRAWHSWRPCMAAHSNLSQLQVRLYYNMVRSALSTSQPRSSRCAQHAPQAVKAVLCPPGCLPHSQRHQLQHKARCVAPVCRQHCLQPCPRQCCGRHSGRGGSHVVGSRPRQRGPWGGAGRFCWCGRCSGGVPPLRMSKLAVQGRQIQLNSKVARAPGLHLQAR